MKNTKQNCEKLADVIVDGWDMETLRLFAYESLKDSYLTDKECFNRDWKENME